MNKAIEKVNTEIMQAMKESGMKWVKTWIVRRPLSYISGKAYTGMNSIVLSCHQTRNGYRNPHYLTFKKAREMGLKVKKGSKGCPVLYVGHKEKLERDSRGQVVDAGYDFIRYYHVFNVEQVEGLEEYKKEEWDHQPAVTTGSHKYWENWTDKPELTNGGSQPSYAPINDEIRMPIASDFKSYEAYIATLFHECIHSTGAKKRVGREFGIGKSDPKYAYEELIAELGAAYLCHEAGVFAETKQNSAAYLKSWLKHMQDDPKYIFKASKEAKRAYEYIIEHQKKEEEQEKTTEKAIEVKT